MGIHLPHPAECPGLSDAGKNEAITLTTVGCSGVFDAIADEALALAIIPSTIRLKNSVFISIPPMG